MPRQPSLRASDADREAIAERLRTAAGEGRLDADELEDRLHLALRARTYGELWRLVGDLPGPRERRRVAPLVLFAVLRMLAVLAIAGAVIVVVAFTAAWWIVWAVLWFTLRARRPWWGPRRRPPHLGRVVYHR
jgi:hypothetical protein